jgi:hypothetical protein
VVVTTAPKSAGNRGGFADRSRTHDWDEIAQWHRARPGVKARYGPVPSNYLGEVRSSYPDLVFAGHNHHFQIMASLGHPQKQVCDVYVHYPHQEL